jgi:hypothetical protein
VVLGCFGGLREIMVYWWYIGGEKDIKSLIKLFDGKEMQIRKESQMVVDNNKILTEENKVGA